MNRTFLIAFCVLLAVFLPIRAQVLGGITGTVADSSGAAVPGAVVMIKNVDTNLEIKVITQSNGTYQAPNLPIGNYSVVFAKDGFKTETHPSIKVESGAATTVNGRMEVGSVAMNVEVTGTPMLNQVDTTVGYVLDENTINNTPLGTGSFTQLALLSPGVSADFLSTSGSNGGLGNQAIWSNGQRDTSNSFSINGLSNNNLFNGKSTSTIASSRFIGNTGAAAVSDGSTINTETSVYASIGNSMSTPATETLQELRVNTAMYDASQGGKSGAYISAVTRSGTNAYHGQVYEHFQNSAMNAAPFFRNASPAISAHDKVPKLHYNRFGATLGGPIKKDKLFFFAAFNRIITHDAQNGSRTSKVPVHLSDDRSAAALANVALLDFGKTIAPSQIDPAALKIMNFKLPDGSYMVPSSQITDPATEARLGYDVFLQAPSTFEHYQITGNVDYNISAKDRLSEKFLFQNNPSTSPVSGSATLGFSQVNQAQAKTIVLDNTTILGPSLTWEQKVGLVRMTSYEKTQQPANPEDLGVDIFGSTLFPALNITRGDYASGGSITIGTFAATANAGSFQNQYTGSSTLNWVHGVHNLQAGFNIDMNQLNIVNRANGVAEANFNLFSDFLTGTMATSSFNRYFAGASNRYIRATLAGAFVQDNMRISRNLNVSLGLRYDFNGPFHEKYGNLTNFHPDAFSYNAATDTLTNSGLVVAGNNKLLGTQGVSDSTLTGRQWGLAPRIGIVWSPSGLRNVVVRTGFGMFYDRGEYFSQLSPPAGGGFNGPFGVTLAPPFVQQVVPATNAAGVIIGNLDQPFAGATLPAPVTSLASLNALIPNAANILKNKATYVFGGYDPRNTLPYAENWTMDLQWQPTNSLQMSLGYVGSRSLHQVMPIPFNQPGIATAANPIHGETISYGFNPVPSVETEHNSDGGNTDMRTQYLGYATNSTLYEAVGIADYNSLQFSIRKRLSKGLQLTGAYTWSHTLDEQSGLGLFFNGNDPNNLRSSYGTSTYDRTHNITVQYSYQLPNVTSDHKFLGKVGNGWILNGVTILQSGLPFNAYDFSGAVGGLYYGNNVSVLDPVLPLKPGVTAKQAQIQGSTGFDINKPYVDPNAFAIPQVAPGTFGVTTTCGTVCDTFETAYGSTSRNTFRGPFQMRSDVSLVKQTRVKERYTVRFQGDLFNVFNHASFDAPNVSSSLYSTNNGVPTQRSFTSSFGLIQRTIGGPRLIQLNLSILF